MELLEYSIQGPDGIIHRVERWGGTPEVLSMICRPAYGFEAARFERAPADTTANCIACITLADAPRGP
jgi:hypothetical protein